MAPGDGRHPLPLLLAVHLLGLALLLHAGPQGVGRLGGPNAALGCLVGGNALALALQQQGLLFGEELLLLLRREPGTGPTPIGQGGQGNGTQQGREGGGGQGKA